MKYKLPNLRTLFVPDVGCTIYDCDLSGADAQVVAWEADDEPLKEAFRQGLDVHRMNASQVYPKMQHRSWESLTEEEQLVQRKQFKAPVHGSNYGGTARGLARRIGWTTDDCEIFQDIWFTAHPGIREWQHRIQFALARGERIRNPFGYGKLFLERPRDAYTNALAWIPQSTVALITYRGHENMSRRYDSRGYQLLLQVHDSLVFQFPTRDAPDDDEILETLQVRVPYADPLFIPWGLKKSTKSWGDCH